MYPETPSFGTMIRATRLGWGWARQHGCFIRMSDADGMNSLIELCPMHAVPSKKMKGNYRVWWESPSVLGMIPWLKPIRKVHKAFAVKVDVDGNII